MRINIEQYNLFNDLSEHDINLLKKTAYVSSYKKGEVIHLEEDICETVDLVIKGYIRAEQIDVNGNALVVREFGPNNYIGTNVLYSSNRKYMLHIIAVEETVLHKIPKQTIGLFLENSDFRQKFIKLISDNTMYFGRHIKQSYRKSLREKIITFLEEQILKQHSNTISLNMSKTNLAMIFGVERTSLSRELQKMKNESIIDFDRNTITRF
jgi:CRP-like cAMP-binding protein